jgi:hypothetical protein
MPGSHEITKAADEHDKRRLKTSVLTVFIRSPNKVLHGFLTGRLLNRIRLDNPDMAFSIVLDQFFVACQQLRARPSGRCDQDPVGGIAARYAPAFQFSPVGATMSPRPL